MSASAELNAVLERVAEAQPVLVGSVSMTLRGNTTARAAQLYQYWQGAELDAGRAYWAARSWGQLIWQPLYLSVLSVHLTGALPRLGGLCQDLSHGRLAGFSLPPHRPRPGREAELIALAGRQLRRRLRAWFSALQRLVPYPTQQASALAADCLLGALLLLPGTAGPWSRERLERAATRWLAACQLQERSGLLFYALADGGQSADLARRACCQHYRLDSPCASCPRLRLPERLQRLRQNPACRLAPERAPCSFPIHL